MTILPVKAEDGHALWLRFAENEKPANVNINVRKSSPTLQIAQEELRKYFHRPEAVELKLEGDVAESDNGFCISNDAYSITYTKTNITISASTDVALLYGAYELLRVQDLLSEGFEEPSVDYEQPTNEIRVLNHWDNPDGTVERGFAGRSIFWPVKYEKATEKKPLGNGKITAQQINLWREYARANASLGINATVLNNVNAKPLMLSKQKIQETARIAETLRPYGIRVFLAINFASPKALGDLDTADPLDPRVVSWWQKKADEIYKLIPDFGGFLVKANSEGEPGPMDYGRTHVDGANMLASALKPHKGTVMWRAFVYSPKGNDRASQAYDEFVPFDGQFCDNVIIQIKNGPIDFQPREPVSPLFFGLKKTEMMPEFQITQEYLGHSVHTAFLATMWHEFYNTLDTYKVSDHYRKAVAGVANIGDSQNWCGSDMAQANWYAFGRMAWNDQLQAETIAHDWLRLTFCDDTNFLRVAGELLVGSRETVVDYMMPLGLHHIFAGNHHYGPEPWCAPKGWREDWLPRFYHKADKEGLGFNRTSTGSNNVSQYPEPLRTIYADRNLCPENLVLWFHHVGWDDVMADGQSFWTNLCQRYDRGVVKAQKMADMWKDMDRYVDNERYDAINVRLDRQAKDAVWWRDACLLYFQTFSGKPLPVTSPAPKYKLDDLMKYKLNIDNYTSAPIELLP